MQTQLLEQNPSADWRVYAIWMPVLWGDRRLAWNGNTMPDPRVTHYWDGDRAVGGWFAGQVDGYAGVSWDSYYLYGPDAVWTTAPSPLLGSGGTIHAKREQIAAALAALLRK